MSSRREFINNSIKASVLVAATPNAAFSFLRPSEANVGGTSSTVAEQRLAPAAMTVQNVIDLIMKEIGTTIDAKSVDTIKSGKPDTVVTGIICTMFATIDIIAQAKKIGANFIIAHEPSFYNHTDSKDYVAKNDVLKDKLSILEKDNIVVWRFHDYCHQIKPEPMTYGVAKRCGWTGYYKSGYDGTIEIPAMQLSALADHLKKSLGIQTLRIIGDLNQSCSKLALLPGASGGQSHLNSVENHKPDVLIVGEVHEWETAEYIRDSKQEGKKTALIILGHSVSEEPGMEVVTDWLAPKLPGIKVTHIASGDPFTWR